MIDLKSMTRDEITEYVKGLGEPAFRGKQISSMSCTGGSPLLMG